MDVQTKEEVVVERPKENVSPIEMLNRLRSWLKKYGYTFDDSELASVIENIKLKKIHIAMENDKYHLLQLDNALNPEVKDQKILVFPRGKYYIQKYDKWLEFDDKFYGEIADSFDDPALTKPFLDKNHELAESYGNILNYEITTEGMYFEVQLNDDGKGLVRNNNYKFISPTFGAIIDTQGQEHENVLVSISMTNVPALMSNIPALQEQLELETKKPKIKKEIKMDLKKLAQKLELQDEASMTAIAEAVQALMDEGVDKAQIIQGLNDTIKQLTESNEEMSAAMNKVNEELTLIKKADLEKEAENTIDLAIKSGQYHPALKEIKLKQFLTNKEEVLKELDIIPKIDAGQESLSLPNGVEFDEEDKKIALSAGYDLEKAEDRIKFKSVKE